MKVRGGVDSDFGEHGCAAGDDVGNSLYRGEHRCEDYRFWERDARNARD